MTTVAVVIPYFQRRPGILRRALASVLGQALPAGVTVRVLVVDDGSPAPARDELEGLETGSQVSIELIEQANAGVGAARNAGLRAAAAGAVDYVAFLDSDDMWAPTHLASAVTSLEAGSDVYFCDAKRDRRDFTYFNANPSFAAYLARYGGPMGRGDACTLGPARFFDYCLRARPFQTSTVVYRRSAAAELRFDESLTVAGEDSLFFLRLIQRAGAVSCSRRVDVQCLDGENIYYSSVGWDDPGTLARQMSQVRAYDAFLAHLSLSRANAAFVRRQRADDRLKFGFLSLRYVLKRRRWPPPLPAAPGAETTQSWRLPSLLASGLGYVTGLYSPARPPADEGARLPSLRVLMVSSMPYAPQHHSGANTSVDQLCVAMRARGHHVAVLVGLLPSGRVGMAARVRLVIARALTGTRVSKDATHGYAVWRTWFPREAMGYVVRREKPDVVLIAAGEIASLAQSAMETGVPVHVTLTDVEFAVHGGDLASLGDVPSTANSHFTAQAYSERFGIKPNVIYPLVQLEKYRVESTRAYVTFINPHPMKGRDIALAVAGMCPEIKFAFVRSWFLGEELERELAAALASLPNVTLLEARDDMRSIYSSCKILLVPSVWGETFGRVVTEAQASGIPAIVSARGGLPEATGPGGVFVDPDGPIEAWVDAVRTLWRDERRYAELSEAALAHAQRSEMSPAALSDAWEESLLATAARGDA